MTIKERILKSIQPIIDTSKYVFLNREQLSVFSKKLIVLPLPPQTDNLPFTGNEEDTLTFYFILDNINFCSLPEKGKEKWYFEKEGKWISGHYGRAWALKQAVEKNPQLLQSDYLTHMSYEEFANIFRGKGKLLLMRERHRIIQENFSIIKERFGGKVLHIIKEGDSEANTIVNILVEAFPRFKDICEYSNNPVYFLKLAQIFVSDINFALEKNNRPYIKNLKDLTVFADNKLPQLLQAENVLQYTDQLLKKVRGDEVILHCSQEEMEIRAYAIYACELLRDEIEKLGKTFTTNELDWILWSQAKQREFTLPYHRTVSIYY